jgi:hypothetical protein
LNQIIVCLIYSILITSAIVLGYDKWTNHALASTIENSPPDNTSESSSLFADGADTSTNVSDLDSISTAQTVFESGTMKVPASVSGVIIFIPDEAHHPPEDEKTISPMNPNYLPTTLEVPDGTEVAFVHDDPTHTHIGIVKDKDGSTVWTTIPVEFPDGSDSRTLNALGSPYSVSDEEFSPPMNGTIIVTSEKSTGTLTVGGFFCPTDQVAQCKAELLDAGFEILSEFNFETESVQKDISGPNTLMIYSTLLSIKEAMVKLGPIIELLPYK